MAFIWFTLVGVGNTIDAADRNETRTNIEWLYTALGANWPGNVRFPICVGAGYDIAAPCPVVWPIAVGDSIYQTPTAHPVSELQEARDKIDWIHTNMCGVDNAVANPNTQLAANPTTQAAADPATQAAANPATQAVANPTTQAAADPATQALERAVTNVSNDPGCDADCPLENPAANPTTETGEDSTANGGYFGINQTDLTIDLDANQSGYDYQDYGAVCPAQYSTFNLVIDVLVYEVAQASHCTSENAGVYTHVFSPVA